MPIAAGDLRRPLRAKLPRPQRRGLTPVAFSFTGIAAVLGLVAPLEAIAAWAAKCGIALVPASAGLSR